MRKTPISGLRAWMIQRLSAVYLLVFLLFFLGYFAFYPPASYEAWRDWISGTAVVTATGVFFIALFIHAWVGLRDVILDYAKPLAVRVVLLTLLALSLAALTVWVLRVLLLAAT